MTQRQLALQELSRIESMLRYAYDGLSEAQYWWLVEGHLLVRLAPPPLLSEMLWGLARLP